MSGDLSTPGELMLQIERDARSLDAGGRQLAQVIKRLGELERDYERAVEEALISIYHDAKESGDRMPAEDVRRALAHQAVPSAVYGSYLAAKAQADALRAWCRITEAALSARQSLLACMRAELKAVA